VAGAFKSACTPAKPRHHKGTFCIAKMQIVHLPELETNKDPRRAKQS